IVLYIILLSTVSCQSQSKILFASSGPVQNQFVKDNKLTKLHITYQSEFVKKNGTQFDSVTFLKTLDRKIPNKKEIGYASLDWEGEALKVLTSNKSSDKEVNQIKNEFIKALLFAKRERPNIKWSYYG